MKNAELQESWRMECLRLAVDSARNTQIGFATAIQQLPASKPDVVALAQRYYEFVKGKA